MKKLRFLSMSMAAIVVFAALVGCGGGASSASNASKTPASDSTAGGSGAEPIVIRCGSMSNPNNFTGKASIFMNDKIKELTNGEVEIDMYDQGQLGMDADLITQVIDGTLPFVNCSISILSLYSPLLDAVQLPFLISSYQEELAGLQSDEFWALADRVGEEIGIKIVATGENGLRHFENNVRPINSVADLKGLKMRVPEGEMMKKAVTMLGANPVPLPMNEIYTSLQTHIVDGLDINFMTLALQKHYEVTKYMSLVDMYPFASVYVFNLDYWNNLDPKFQEAIQEAGRQTTELCLTDLVLKEDEAGRKAAEDAGMVINDVSDKQEFLDTLNPLYEEYKALDPMVSAFIDKCMENKKAAS